MIELLVGASWEDYDFNGANRIDWNGEAGDWSYQKTGPDTGLLLFTYDEDGNDANLYREEVVLTFVTATLVAVNTCVPWPFTLAKT